MCPSQTITACPEWGGTLSITQPSSCPHPGHPKNPTLSTPGRVESCPALQNNRKTIKGWEVSHVVMLTNPAGILGVPELGVGLEHPGVKVPSRG